MIIENIPLECLISSKKRFKFNLNAYRNAHYQVLSKAKRWFASWFLSQDLDFKPFESPVEIHYKFWLKRRSDLMNYGAVVDKFLQDALVKSCIIPDDNCDIVKSVTFDFCGYDRYCGHAEAEIKELK